MLLNDAIGDQAFEKMRADPVLFIEAFNSKFSLQRLVRKGEILW